MDVSSVTFSSPVGNLRIFVFEARLLRLELLLVSTQKHVSVVDQDGDLDSAFLDEIEFQLKGYFGGDFDGFSLPVRLMGTPFQQRVWQCLDRIPCGVTWSYKSLAEVCCSSARAVGQACRRNPLPLIIPCHRVVSMSGVGGYAGAVDGNLMLVKRFLLDHEGTLKNNI